MSAASKPAAASRLQTALSWFPVHDFVSLDLRSLALLRIGLAVMLLQEWLNRLVDVRMHYSDGGLLPRAIASAGNPPISIFMLCGSEWFAAALMGVGCVLAVLLFVGWRTQFITLLSWFLLIGVHGRNFVIMQGGDAVMRMLLFWAIFLPLGACYSLDALREPLRDWRPRVLSVASVALIVQMCLIYVFAGAWKTDPAWRTDHTAVYLALSLDGFATPLGHWLLNFPNFLKMLTLATMVLEIFGPALLFLPFANGPIRVFVIVSFCLFHAGLGATMELGNFPWICGVGWIALLPAWFWDRLEARLRSPRRSGLVLYYDGDNGFQRRCVAAARMFLLLYESKMVPAQTDGKRLARVRTDGPWLVVDAASKEWGQYEALLRLVEVSILYWPLAYVLKWGPLRRQGEKRMRWAATRRSKPVEVTTSTAADYPGARLGGWAQNAVVAFFLAYVVIWNIRTLDSSQHNTQYHEYFPEQVSSLGYSLGLDQSWGLFAPRPGSLDGWYVIPARLKNGKIVDLYRDGADLTTAKPALVSATYTNSRTRKYMMNLVRPDLANLRPYYARHLYDNWNRSHGEDEQIEYLFVLFMEKHTQPDRQVDEVTETRLQNYPLEPEMEDPITKKAYPTEALSGAFGLTAPPLVHKLYTRPVLPELMHMKERP